MDSYDYVVVGAGSAGCVLAARLTEAGHTVLLLEAGEEPDRREIDIPIAFSELFRTPVDWDYTTAPQPELDGRELYWPRGKTLGGTSAINAMIYVRGHPTDYDGWAAEGNEGWGYEDVLPAFVRAEHNERGAAGPHGTGGPLNVADLQSPNPLSRAFVEAGVAAGLPRTDDFNDGDQEGVGLYQVTQKRGSRHSAADAYLRPAMERDALSVRTGALATRVLVSDGRATGVEYANGSERVQVGADREVIVSGGTVNSPQLLMLSGVGSADHLEDHGIEVVADRPGVGRNLQDHLVAGLNYEATRPVTLSDAEGLVNYLKYRVLGRGPLTSNVAEAGGFARTDPDLPAPDVQFHFAPAFFVGHGFDTPEGHGFAVGATQLRPASRGHIALRSADPADPPAIDPNYLGDEGDLDVLIAGLRRAREIVEAAPLDPYRGDSIEPSPDGDDDEALAAHVRETAETIYHPVGTCAMGDGPMAVVDDRLRVHGVDGLRVVDASVMPSLVGGNTNAPTIMIAERAAAFVASGR